MKNIDIYTALATTSPPFAIYLRDNMVRMANGDNNLRFHTVGNDLFNSKPIAGWDHIGNVSTNEKVPPSMTHATALHKIYKHIPGDSDIVIIADCDIAMLYKGWDNVIVKELETLDVIGTPKFCGTLSVYLTAFKADVYRKLNPDFTPGNTDQVSVTAYVERDPVKAAIWKLKVPAKIVMDTGWMVAQQIYDKGYKYELFPYHDDYKSKLTFNYLYKGKMFLSHFSGSHKRPYNTEKAKQWRGAVAEFINK